MDEIGQALTGFHGWMNDEKHGPICIFNVSPEFRAQLGLPQNQSYALAPHQVQEAMQACHAKLGEDDVEYETRVLVLSELEILEEASNAYEPWLRYMQKTTTPPTPDLN